MVPEERRISPGAANPDRTNGWAQQASRSLARPLSGPAPCAVRVPSARRDPFRKVGGRDHPRRRDGSHSTPGRNGEAAEGGALERLAGRTTTSLPRARETMRAGIPTPQWHRHPCPVCTCSSSLPSPTNPVSPLPRPCGVLQTRVGHVLTPIAGKNAESSPPVREEAFFILPHVRFIRWL